MTPRQHITTAPMKRIILHWTGGTHRVSDIDRKHYHWIVSGTGDVVAGDLDVTANVPPLKTAQYAAHTRSLNSYSIGVSLAGMFKAKEVPFEVGPYPLTDVQVYEAVQLCAELCEAYGIPVSRETVLTHAEVQPTLGVSQRGKWDITWLPGMDRPEAPVATGDILRARIQEALDRRAARSAPAAAPSRDSPLSALMTLLRRLFKS